MPVWVSPGGSRTLHRLRYVVVASLDSLKPLSRLCSPRCDDANRDAVSYRLPATGKHPLYLALLLHGVAYGREGAVAGRQASLQSWDANPSAPSRIRHGSRRSRAPMAVPQGWQLIGACSRWWSAGWGSRYWDVITMAATDPH